MGMSYTKSNYVSRRVCFPQISQIWFPADYADYADFNNEKG
jgi:hypothetical protein